MADVAVAGRFQIPPIVLLRRLASKCQNPRYVHACNYQQPVKAAAAALQRLGAESPHPPANMASACNQLSPQHRNSKCSFRLTDIQ